MTSPSSERPVIGEAGVRRIAELARLHLEADQIPLLSEHFERMLDFVEKLNEVDVKGVEPDTHPAQSTDQLREDRLRLPASPGGPVEREQTLKNAPEEDGQHFLTPRVI